MQNIFYKIRDKRNICGMDNDAWKKLDEEQKLAELVYCHFGIEGMCPPQREPDPPPREPDPPPREPGPPQREPSSPQRATVTGADAASSLIPCRIAFITRRN